MEWIFLKKSRWNVASKLEATRAVKRLYATLDTRKSTHKKCICSKKKTRTQIIAAVTRIKQTRAFTCIQRGMEWETPSQTRQTPTVVGGATGGRGVESVWN